MIRFIIALAAGLVSSNVSLADLRPPPRTVQAVSDPSMVVMDRGAKLEVFPTRRAMPTLSSSGQKIVQEVANASASAPIGPQQLGVVFNHAMQQKGYITGEIVFKVKGGHAFSGSGTQYPGLKEITKPAVYAVNARTPAEFITVLKRLQARSDLEWVEPTVTYGGASSSAKSAAP
jgi:hypothetical protein